MTKVNSNTEWGTLKEVILGRAEYAQVPGIKRHDIHCVDYANYDSVNGLPGGYYPEQIIEETVEDLNIFQNQLEQAGVKVNYDSYSTEPAVYLLAHPVDYSDANFTAGSVVVDMYRKYNTFYDKIKVVHYGRT